MKKIPFFAFLLLNTSIFAQNNTLYNDTKVPSIFITLAQDSLNLLLQIGNEESNHYFPATFIFDTGTKKDTVKKVGLRLRGNTSRTSAKKSFKVSFNQFDNTQRYQGVKKLNLNGQHNDPTMIREKLFYDIWKKAGNPERRANFVRLYINKEYKGAYTNIEEIDTDWLKRTYGENKGNLYKCTYPADLAYLGDNQNTYKKIENNPTTRAYDLSTNETADDYSDLVNLTKQLNQPIDNQFVTNIEKILNVESVIKAFALDVALGNWDDYAYNKNNYFIYHNQTTKKFEFITYDTDNSIGVDWVGKDWTTRDCYKWLPTEGSEKRPLVSKLLQVPAYKNMYSEYLNQVTKNITRPDSIFPRVDVLRNIIKTAALADTYKSKDWGYTNTSWEDGFTKTIDKHTPYGIKPFFTKRYNSTIAQVIVPTIDNQEVTNIFIYPNPVSQTLYLDFLEESKIQKGDILDFSGKVILHFESNEKIIDVSNLPNGMYVLKIGNWVGKFVKM